MPFQSPLGKYNTRQKQGPVTQLSSHDAGPETCIPPRSTSVPRQALAPDFSFLLTQPLQVMVPTGATAFLPPAWETWTEPPMPLWAPLGSFHPGLQACGQ